MSEQSKIMEAYKSMVSEAKGKDRRFPLHKKDEAEAYAKKFNGKVEKKGGTLYVTCEEADLDEKKLDPVDKKELKGKHSDRDDKDIDNDGDVDDSDEYLHKRRKATQDAIDDAEDDAKKEKKTDMKKNPKTSDKTAEISKIGEAFVEMWDAIEEARKETSGALEGEKADSKESPKAKEFAAKHKVDSKDHEDMEKVEEPKERKVKKEDVSEYEVIRRILSGQIEEK